MPFGQPSDQDVGFTFGGFGSSPAPATGGDFGGVKPAEVKKEKLSAPDLSGASASAFQGPSPDFTSSTNAGSSETSASAGNDKKPPPPDSDGAAGASASAFQGPSLGSTFNANIGSFLPSETSDASTSKGSKEAPKKKVFANIKLVPDKATRKDI